jgi:hypothetical protein
MILTKRDLRKRQKSTFTPITEEQRRAILNRFGTEPWPYEWSEQDIDVQIQNFLGCGEFVKAIQSSGNGSNLLLDEDF